MRQRRGIYTTNVQSPSISPDILFSVPIDHGRVRHRMRRYRLEADFFGYLIAFSHAAQYRVWFCKAHISGETVAAGAVYWGSFYTWWIKPPSDLVAVELALTYS